MMNIDGNQDPVPHDEPDDPEFIQAALLLKKMWDLNPDSRPVPKREFPETVAAQGPAQQTTPHQEDLTMLPAEERHERKCLVCHHPDREEIEEEFIHWRDVWYLAKQYNIADPRSIDRHARAFDLVERRRENRRYMLDRILENGPGKVTPGLCDPGNPRLQLPHRRQSLDRPAHPRRIRHHHQSRPESAAGSPASALRTKRRDRSRYRD
jgi:hypothetical protein